MKDLIDRLTSWKTTIIGAATLIISLLVLFNVITPERQEDAIGGVTNLWEGIIQVLAAISGLILIFSHDSTPKIK